MLPDKNMQEDVSNWTSIRELKEMFISKCELELEVE